jgi:luciferase family oxidoreductase group 1
VRLGVLDIQHPQWAIELAPNVEHLGLSRYWLGEHHGSAVQSGSPEVLTGIIAAITHHIRVGPAGVLLRSYSPIKVAQDYRLLEEIFRPRIDLGVARGAGGDAAVAKALLDGRPSSLEIYEGKVRELAQLLQGRLPEGHAARGAPCFGSTAPPTDFWVLGAKRRTALLAASVGAAFGFSDYLARMSDPDVDGTAIVRAYRDAFEPNPSLPAPRWNVAIAGAAVRRAARGLATVPMAGPPPMIGTVAKWRQRLRELSERHEADELMILDVCERFTDRRRSFELLAEAAELTGPA